MLTNYLVSLILTIIVEVAIARIFFYEKFIIAVVILMNLISHPVFNFSLFILKYNFGWQITWLQIIFFEIVIFLFEAFILYFVGFRRPKALMLSFCANGASFLVGYMLIELKLIFLYL